MGKYKIKLNLSDLQGAYLSGIRDKNGKITKNLVIPVDGRILNCVAEERNSNEGQDEFVIKNNKRVIGYMTFDTNG